MKLPKLEDIKTEADARSLAIVWQVWQSDKALSYSDIATISSYFGQVADKFNLTEEFKENGIL